MGRCLAAGRRDALTRNVQSGAKNGFRSHECGPLRTFQLEQLQWWGQRPHRDSEGGGTEALSGFPPRLGTPRCQSISQNAFTSTAACPRTPTIQMPVGRGDDPGLGRIEVTEPAQTVHAEGSSVCDPPCSRKWAAQARCGCEIRQSGAAAQGQWLRGPKLLLGGDELGAGATCTLSASGHGSRPRNRRAWRPWATGLSVAPAFAAESTCEARLREPRHRSPPKVASWGQARNFAVEKMNERTPGTCQVSDPASGIRHRAVPLPRPCHPC